MDANSIRSLEIIKIRLWFENVNRLAPAVAPERFQGALCVQSGLKYSYVEIRDEHVIKQSDKLAADLIRPVTTEQFRGTFRAYSGSLLAQGRFEFRAFQGRYYIAFFDESKRVNLSFQQQHEQQHQQQPQQKV